MNDEFLYDLRAPPSQAFAAQLKARLDIHASDAQRQRRAVKWFTLGAIFMGGVALAFLSPAVREVAMALMLQFRGAPSSDSLRQAAQDEPRSLGSALPTTETRSSGSSSAPSDESRKMESVGPTSADTSGSFVTNHSNSSAGPVIISSEQKIPTDRIAYTKRLEHLVTRLTGDLEALDKINVTTAVVAASVNPCARDFDATIGMILSDRRLSEDAQIDCSSSAVRFVELPFAYDAIVIITNAENTWARALSLDDFHKVRDSHPSDPITTWSQVR
ncbi:MAG TPA: hypothetical protein VNA21_05305, partial [Steroidobacteraceae bacterium]|nr:hypothetical protein [Steroidobacteraceae bacterium]